MLTRQQTDALVNELHARATAAGWPDHTAENSRNWLRHGAIVVHVGPEVIAIRTWTGSILREFRMTSPDWSRRANEEYYGLEGAPVIDENARLIAQSGGGEHEATVADGRGRKTCLTHGTDREFGCSGCGLPVIERVGHCGCPPAPSRWVNGRPSIRSITNQIDHTPECPGFASIHEVVPVESAEIVRPKKKVKAKIISLELPMDLAARKPDEVVTGPPTVVAVPPTVPIQTTHTCHAHDCSAEVEPAKFACPRHWYSLRHEMQDAIWREYRVEQEVTKTPTLRYLAVQQRAVAEIAMYRPRSAKNLAGWSEAAAREIAAPYFANSERWRQLAIERGEGDPMKGL